MATDSVFSVATFSEKDSNQLLTHLMQAIQSGTPCTSTHEPPGGIISDQPKQAIKHLRY